MVKDFIMRVIFRLSIHGMLEDTVWKSFLPILSETSRFMILNDENDDKVNSNCLPWNSSKSLIALCLIERHLNKRILTRKTIDRWIYIEVDASRRNPAANLRIHLSSLAKQPITVFSSRTTRSSTLLMSPPPLPLLPPSSSWCLSYGAYVN